MMRYSTSEGSSPAASASGEQNGLQPVSSTYSTAPNDHLGGRGARGTRKRLSGWRASTSNGVCPKWHIPTLLLCSAHRSALPASGNASSNRSGNAFFDNLNLS